MRLTDFRHLRWQITILLHESARQSCSTSLQTLAQKKWLDLPRCSRVGSRSMEAPLLRLCRKKLVIRHLANLLVGTRTLARPNEALFGRGVVQVIIITASQFISQGKRLLKTLTALETYIRTKCVNRHCQGTWRGLSIAVFISSDFA